jgi:hypothetical protein
LNYDPFTYLRAITIPCRDRISLPGVLEKQGRQEDMLPPYVVGRQVYIAMLLSDVDEN